MWDKMTLKPSKSKCLIVGDKVQEHLTLSIFPEKKSE